MAIVHGLRFLSRGSGQGYRRDLRDAAAERLAPLLAFPSSDYVRRSFLCYFKTQHALPTSRIMSHDGVGSWAGDKRLRIAGVLEFPNTFALRVTKLDGRTAMGQRNQLAWTDPDWPKWGALFSELNL